jgi:hypothetical protein
MILRGRIAVTLVASVLVACEMADPRLAGVSSPSTGNDPIFSEDFESGTLTSWQDGVDPMRHRIVSDAASAQSGNRYLAVTYPPGADGGWLTRFLPPGYDSLFVSYYVRFPPDWQGGTKLIGFYGTPAGNQWSAFGKAGVCPMGADYLAAMLVSEPSGDPGPVRFYTYYPAMAREPDGVTCWGRYGDGSETYASPPAAVKRGAWHHIEFSVTLNAPGRSDARQMFWIDGVPQASWDGFSFGDTATLRLNAVQLSFSVTDGVGRARELHVDNLLVRPAPPVR